MTPFSFHLTYLAFCLLLFFFFNDTATTEIYTLSLHDALPISDVATVPLDQQYAHDLGGMLAHADGSARLVYICNPNNPDRKSTRLNSSHSQISYAVFCLKKKNNKTHRISRQPRDSATEH